MTGDGETYLTPRVDAQPAALIGGADGRREPWRPCIVWRSMRDP